MKKTITTILCLFIMLTLSAQQGPQRFSPEKFQADLEQFIVKEANLTQQEAAKFLPLYREMQQKQRAVYAKIKKECSQRPSNEEEIKKVVQKRDAYELELKTIQQTYHNKFFKVLQPSKVFDAIIAEDRFHRRAFRNWGKQHAASRPVPRR
jgi:Spy/CpxP family protein refolding chaperone